MRKTFSLIAFLILSQFSTMAFALDPEWKLYTTYTDGGKIYFDTKNSYYKNGKVIVWNKLVKPAPTTIAVPDGHDVTYDNTVTKSIYVCDNTQYWYLIYSSIFFNKDIAVLGEANNSTKFKADFTPGDLHDKYRNFLCANLKPFWKLP